MRLLQPWPAESIRVNRNRARFPAPPPGWRESSRDGQVVLQDGTAAQPTMALMRCKG